MSDIIQELRYPQLSLVRWLFPHQWHNPCMFWQVLCLACKYLIFLPIYELAAMKQPKNVLHLPKTTWNTRKIANKLLAITSAEINLQSKHDLICHVAKVKAAMSAHSMADVIPFYSVFIISLRIQRFDKIKRKDILPTVNKTTSVTLSLY